MIIVIVSKNTVTFWLEPQPVNLALTKTVQFRLTLISFPESKADEKEQKEKEKKHRIKLFSQNRLLYSSEKKEHEMTCLI